ncbi:MAG: D-aminoacylase [Acidobacteriaceae bacterium]|nr:D-aminoacylase [Acidobacteriaceae bacterium]
MNIHRIALVMLPGRRAMRQVSHTLRALLLAVFIAAGLGTAQQRYDVLIRNGHIIDGTGSPWYVGDIAIVNGRIERISVLPTAQATTVIDARGMIVAPGFIDMLGQSEASMLVNPHVPSKIFQGITTEITGEGDSIAPLNARLLAADTGGLRGYGIKPDWTTFSEYFARLKRTGMGINLASYVGATQVRRYVIGEADRPPTAAELDEMKALVRQAMLDGAVGLSTSLQYAPAPFASTGELIELASAAAPFGGIYATHMRSEGDAIDAALDETFRIGREANIPVEIWHLKAAGKKNWGRMPEIVSRIDHARASGIDVEADTYAYPAWFNSFSAFIPPWAHDGGDSKLIERLKDPATRVRIRKQMETDSITWDNEWLEVPGPEGILVCVVRNPALLPLQGKTIAQIAREEGKDPIDTIFDLLILDPGMSVAVFAMSEQDVALALKQPWVSVDNDSQGTAPTGSLAREHPHPRAYGTFPRILRKYVHEDHLLTLEDAIRKFSALPAQRMRLTDRGVLKQGMCADIVVFDPETVHDLATFEKPNQLSVGMQYVLVNGVAVIAQGKPTDALPGKVLLGQGSREQVH